MKHTMKYCKVENGKITEVFETDCQELAELNGYTTPCEREIVQVYDRSYKFADEVTPEDFKPTLNEAKASKIDELKSSRDTKEVEPIQTDKGLFDYDDKSRDRLAIARQALTDGDGAGTITWTTADNQRVPLGIVDFANINAAAAVRSNQLHITYNNLKEQVNSATTTEEVEAIVWPED